MSSSKLLVTAAFLTVVCPSSRAVFIRAPSAVTITSASPSLSDLAPTTLGLLHHMSLGFPHSPHFAQTAAHVCDTRHLWAAALSSPREAAELVLHLLEAGRWNTTWGAVPPAAKADPRVVAAAIRKGVIRYEEELAAEFWEREGIYNQFPAILAAAITAGFWRNRSFWDLPDQVLAGQQAGSGAVVGAAILERLEGAPQELAAVQPAFLQDDEDVLLAAIWRDWFRHWDELPDAARASVRVMREFFQAAAEDTEEAQMAEDYDALGGDYVAQPGEMPLLSSLKHEAQQWDLNLIWEDLVDQPAQGDARVVRHVLRLNRILRVFQTWNQLPEAAKLDVECVILAMRAGLLTRADILEDAAYLPLEPRGTWRGFFASEADRLHEDPLANPFPPDRLHEGAVAAEAVATSAEAVKVALERGVLHFWAQVPEELRGNVAVVTAYLESHSYYHIGVEFEPSVRSEYSDIDLDFDFHRDVHEPAASDEGVRAKASKTKSGATLTESKEDESEEDEDEEAAEREERTKAADEVVEVDRVSAEVVLEAIRRMSLQCDGLVQELRTRRER